MPLVLREAGFEVRIYLNDHPPAHVHVFNSDGEAQITLEPVRLDKVWSMKPADARRAKALVVTHRAELLAKWKELHARSNV